MPLIMLVNLSEKDIRNVVTSSLRTLHRAFFFFFFFEGRPSSTVSGSKFFLKKHFLGT